MAWPPDAGCRRFAASCGVALSRDGYRHVPCMQHGHMGKAIPISAVAGLGAPLWAKLEGYEALPLAWNGARVLLAGAGFAGFVECKPQTRAAGRLI